MKTKLFIGLGCLAILLTGCAGYRNAGACAYQDNCSQSNCSYQQSCTVSCCSDPCRSSCQQKKVVTCNVQTEYTCGSPDCSYDFGNVGCAD